MPTSLVVVDDFVQEPDKLRDMALKLTYPPQQGAFPGRNSQERIELPGLLQEVSRCVGEQLRLLDPPESHAKCRITLAADKGMAHVHIDRTAYWSGILYLTLPQDCRGGTQFFRHRRTDSDHAPLTLEQLTAWGYDSPDAMYADIIGKDSNDASKWEPTMSVPMRYNRLVLLRPWLWRSDEPAFGDSIENGRLVYLMFFGPAGG